MNAWQLNVVEIPGMRKTIIRNEEIVMNSLLMTTPPSQTEWIRPKIRSTLKFILFEKSNFVQKFNFDKPPSFSQVFHPNFFDNFSREIKVVNSQKVQNHNIFTSFSPKKIDNFLGKSKLNFWT